MLPTPESLMRLLPIFLACAALPLSALELLPADTPIKGGLPAGWEARAEWIGSKVAVVKGEAGPAIQVVAEKPMDVMINRTIEVPAGNGPVVLRATVTCSEPVKGGNAWERPNLVLVAFDAAGKQIKDLTATQRFENAEKDKAIELRLAAPDKAARLQVRLGFLQSSGTLRITALSVTR